MFFSVRPIICFLVQPFLLTSMFLCACFVRSSRVIRIVNSISSLDELFFALRANAVVNIV